MADRSHRSPTVLALVGAAAVALAAVPYLPGLPGDFVYDDHRLIVGNDGLKRPLDLGRAFLRDYYASDTDRMGLGYYRPFAVLSNEFDYRRGGGRPAPFHATNIALHAGSTLLVFLLAVRLFGGNALAAGFAAGLFALHPAHAESVAFISGRVDPLATFFSLATVLAHLQANHAATPRAWRAAVGGAWLAALLSKEVAAVVPAIVFLIESAGEGRPGRQDVLRRSSRYAPYLVVASVYLALRVVALGELLPPGPEGEAFSPARPFVVVGTYIAWLVLPPPGLHLEPSPPAGGLAVGAALLAVGFAAAALLAWRRGSRVEAALAGWCVLGLLPVSQVKPLETVLSERFLYLPSAGMSLLLAGLLAGPRATGSTAPRGARLRALGPGLLAVVALGYGAILLPRVSTWRDEIALWQAKEREDGGSIKARLNLARAYARRGDRENSRRWYEATKRIAPALAAGLDAEIARLGALLGSDEYEAALRRAIESLPNDGALWNNLGFHLLEKRDTAGAKEAFSNAVRLTPMRASCWLGLALVHLRAGEWEQAAEASSRAAALDPSLALARAVLAECRVRQGRPCEALAISEGLRLDSEADQATLDRVRAAARRACPGP